MNTTKELTKIKSRLERSIDYCLKHNGVPYCKNCGLGNSVLIDLDKIIKKLKAKNKKNNISVIKDKKDYWIIVKDKTINSIQRLAVTRQELNNLCEVLMNYLKV